MNYNHTDHSHFQSHNTHNQLNITNQPVKICQSDHVNLGCAPKKKKKILRMNSKATRVFSFNVKQKTPESSSYAHHTNTECYTWHVQLICVSNHKSSTFPTAFGKLGKEIKDHKKSLFFTHSLINPHS